MADLTLRIPKGAPITWEEMDSNLSNLDSDSPWHVAASHITYNKNVGIGPGASSPTYHLDFGTGDSSNEATIGTQDADLHVHVDGARKFKVTTNSQERITLTTDGKLGIGQSDPQFEVDVDGYINLTNTLYANNVEANSFADGTLSISGGNITNAARIVSTSQIDFTQLYDRTTGHTVNKIDQTVVNNNSGFPTTQAVYNVQQTLQSNINATADRVVSIGSGTGISVSGSYPNFSVSNTAPDRTVALSGTGGIAISGSYPNFTIDASGAQGTPYTGGNGIGVAGSSIAMTGSFSGTFTASGDVVAFSDAALKTDIIPIENALDKLRGIGGYTFLKENDKDRRTGVLAQEIEKVLPEAIHKSEDGTLGVAYGNLIGLLIEAIKELESRLDK